MNKLVVVLGAMMCATSAQAVNLGIGNQQCSEVIEAAQQNKAVGAAAIGCVQGYITHSTNTIKPEIRALYRTPEPDELVAFIADYCRKYPKDPFAGAALTLDAKMNNDALERLDAIADQAAKRK